MAEKQKNRRKNNSLESNADHKGKNYPNSDQIIDLVKNVKEQAQKPARSSTRSNINLTFEKAVGQFTEHRRRPDHKTDDDDLAG